MQGVAGYSGVYQIYQFVGLGFEFFDQFFALVHRQRCDTIRTQPAQSFDEFLRNFLHFV